MNQGSISPNDLLLLRRRLKLSQQALAEHLGVSREWVSKMENGREDISELTQRKFIELKEETDRELGSRPAETLQNAYGSGRPVPIMPPMRVNPAYATPPANPTRADVEQYVGECLDLAEQIPGGVPYLHFALTSDGYLEKLRAKLGSVQPSK